MFSSTLSRRDYARAVGVRFGLFASGALAIPAALHVLNQTQYCPPDFCGPMAASLITFMVMPVLYLGLMLSLIGISVRRLHDMGLSGALAAAIPMLMLGDLLAGLTLDGFVFDSYRRGVVHPIPGNLVMAVACIGFLCVVRRGDEIGDEFTRRWGIVGALACGVVALASTFALLKFISEVSMAVGGVWSKHVAVYGILYAGAIVMPILLIALFAAMAFRERRLRAAS
jgi:uncharacterized membrane protein YhaH (DUF805 family)